MIITFGKEDGGKLRKNMQKHVLFVFVFVLFFVFSIPAWNLENVLRVCFESPFMRIISNPK